MTYNANNQQTVFGANMLTYDLNGNLQTVTDASGTATYAWNARNQLAAITAPGFAASFQYDSFGRRTGRTVQGVTTNFVYDGLNPVQEKNGATVTANLLTGLGLDEFFQRTDGVGSRALLPDALGSTVALGDSTGTLQTQYTYEPFGATSATGAASTSSYKYTGREDDGTGLYYYRARYYHPRLQRFISEDPIGFGGGGPNFYSYVGNGPLAAIDPTGLADKKIGGDLIRVHKNDPDPWPSDPHGHIYDKNQVIDKDGNIYDKNTGKQICKLSGRNLQTWLNFLRKIGKLGAIGTIFSVFDPDDAGASFEDDQMAGIWSSSCGKCRGNE